jgi:hypothetical protein
MTMTKNAHEINELADLVADKVLAKIMPQLPVHTCNLDPDELAFIKNTSRWIGKAKVTAFTSAVGVLTLLVLSAIGWGVVTLFKRAMNQ